MEYEKSMGRIVILTREMYPRVGRILTRFRSAMVNSAATV
jgi:hypothetical protein